MTKRKQTTTAAVRMPIAQLDYLNELARTIGYKEHKNVSYQDLVRQAVNTIFPESLQVVKDTTQSTIQQ